MDISSTIGATAAGQTGNSQRNDDLGKQEFLNLLTTQLANQDPLDPMDNTEFVAQLSQFSSLESLVNIGSAVEQLAIAQAVSNSSNMVGYIGKEVVHGGNGFDYSGEGGKDIEVEVADAASKVTVSVYDENGELVATVEGGPMAEGRGSVEWDGTDVNGQPVDEGSYTVKVSAEDSDGNAVNATTRQTGTVSGVTYENGYPELIVNGEKVALGDIVEVTGSGDTASNTSEESEDDYYE